MVQFSGDELVFFFKSESDNGLLISTDMMNIKVVEDAEGFSEWYRRATKKIREPKVSVPFYFIFSSSSSSIEQGSKRSFEILRCAPPELNPLNNIIGF